MPYNVTLSNGTQHGKKILKNAIFLYSVPFFVDENKEKVEKFSAALEKAKTVVQHFDCLSTDVLNRHNVEIVYPEKIDKESSRNESLRRADEFKSAYGIDQKIKGETLGHIFSWEDYILKNMETPVGMTIREFVAFFFQNNICFSQKVNKSIADRLGLLSAKFPKINLEIATKKIKDYLLEECEAILFLRYVGTYDALIYLQGKLNDPTEYLATSTLENPRDEPILLKINQHPLIPITVIRHELMRTPKISVPLLNDAKDNFFPSIPTVPQEMSNFFVHPYLFARAFFDSVLHNQELTAEQKLFLVEGFSKLPLFSEDMKVVGSKNIVGPSKGAEKN